MKNIDLISCDSDPLSESEVNIVESELGPLPADFRTYLLESNGGRVDGFYIFSPDNGFGVSEFTVIEYQFPPPVITVALGGNSKRIIEVAVDHVAPYMMSLDQADFGSIYFWNYENEARWDAEDTGRQYLPGDTDTTRIADSFTEFVKMLVLQKLEKPDVPKLTSMQHSPENFARYGDNFLSDTKNYFDNYSLNELNNMSSANNSSLLAIAGGYKQTQTVNYLIQRGVDTTDALARCCSSFAISEILVNAGASDQAIKEHLTKAALTIPTTNVPEENKKIIAWLIDKGVRIDFNDPVVVARWNKDIRTIKTKKILGFYVEKFEFPPEIRETIDRNLSRPSRYGVFGDQ